MRFLGLAFAAGSPFGAGCAEQAVGAREYQVHPLLVTQWEMILRDRMPETFEKAKVVGDDSERTIAALHQKIGQLTVELDWLKSKCSQ